MPGREPGPVQERAEGSGTTRGVKRLEGGGEGAPANSLRWGRGLPQTPSKDSRASPPSLERARSLSVNGDQLIPAGAHFVRAPGALRSATHPAFILSSTRRRCSAGCRCSSRCAGHVAVSVTSRSAVDGSHALFLVVSARYCRRTCRGAKRNQRRATEASAWLPRFRKRGGPSDRAAKRACCFA